MYYYNRSDDNIGCLIYLIIGVFILGYWGISECISKSQRGVMKAARSEYCYTGGYEKYLNKWPDGKYSKEAADSIVSICSRRGIDAIGKMVRMREKYDGTELSSRLNQLVDEMTESAYEEACRTSTVEGWEKYMKAVPKEYWRDAEEQVRNVRFQLTEPAYKKACRTATIAGWEEFKRNVPMEFWRDADKHIQNIKSQRWGTESRAWATATGMNTVDGYKTYMKKYPNGAHYEAADKKMIDLTVQSVFSGKHGTLPSMNKSYWSYHDSGTSIITAENGTPYTLTIYYSGSDSRMVVIKSGDSRSVTLTNGTYRIAASVSAHNVRSYAGTETLTGGGYDVMYYISSSTTY